MKITRKQIRKLITEVRMANGGGMPVKSRANPEFAAIIKGKRNLKEYSDYNSIDDLADNADDLVTILEPAMEKYVDSGWLKQNGEIRVVDLMEKLFGTATELAIELNSLRGLMRESEDRVGRVGGGNQWADDEDDLNEQDQSDEYGSEADEWYEYRHGADQEDMEYYIAVSLENAARANSGVNGQNLLKIARQDPEYSSVLQGIPDEKMWEVADTMIEDDTLFFDVEEDAWYYAPEMR